MASGPDRDRFGRPLVVPRGGGKAVPYQRCTTFIDVLEDKSGLQKWAERQVAVGLSRRPDLVLAVQAANGNKAQIDSVVATAHEVAGSYAKATVGTALHALTERVDRREPFEYPLSNETMRDLEAYEKTTRDKGLVVEEIEVFVVNDDLMVGGTFDRIVSLSGVRYMADIKTGSLEYGERKIPMQLAVYASSLRYDPKTFERTELNVSRELGLVIHLPAGAGKCELVWANLDRAARGIELAAQVREWRRGRGFFA